MKKLFALVSVILCMAMLAMSAAASQVPEIPDNLNAREVAKKIRNKTVALDNLELKIAYRTTYGSGDSAYSSVEAMSVKFAGLSGDSSKFRAEMLQWENSDEYSAQMYIKDGYMYDSETREKTRYDDIIGFEDDIGRLYQSLIDTLLLGDEGDWTGFTAEKLPEGGYRLDYKMDGDKCTVFLSEDYIVKSFQIATTERYDTTMRMSTKIEIIINEPVDIVFPYDLYTYKTVD